MQRGEAVHFDGWTLDPGSGELSRGDVRVRLQRQPQLILEELLSRPGEVVTRATLTARLWPRTIVDFDMALNSAVRRLRTTLRDDPERPRYIETVPRRGYRYVGPRPVPAPRSAVPLPTGDRTADAAHRPEPRPAADAQPRKNSDRGLRPWGLIALLGLGMIGATAWRSGLRPSDGFDGTAGPSDAAAARDDLTPGPQAPADDPISSEASERYALARHLFQRRGTGDTEAALRAFSDVVTREPGFAPAWAGLASATWIEIVEGRMDAAEGLPRVRKAAERALTLDPRLSEAHLRLALFHHRTGDQRRADEHFRLALDSQPNDPLALMFASNQALRDGRVDEAIALYKQAVEVDPLSAVARQNLAWLLFRTGRVADARAEASKLLELYPGREDATSMLCISLATAGRYADALVVDQRAPAATADRAQCRALALAGLGRSADARAALDALAHSTGGETELQVAEYYAQTGDADRAFEWLRRAAQRDADRSENWMIRRSPLLEPLTDDARWDALFAAAVAGRD